MHFAFGFKALLSKARIINALAGFLTYPHFEPPSHIFYNSLSIIYMMQWQK